MQTRIVVLAIVCVLFLTPALVLSLQKGGEDIAGPYDAVAGWPQPFTRTGYIWGSQSGVFAETPNRIFLLGRGELKLPEKSQRVPDLGARSVVNGNWARVY